MQELDPRIVKVGIEVSGQIKYYEGLEIVANGTKYANPIQNECEIKISNISKETRDYILTETSPYGKNKTPKRIILEAGRVSFGSSVIFVGDIIASVGGQPPDISLTIKALTGNFDKGSIVSRSHPGKTSLREIAKQTAAALGRSLDFQANDKQIANHSFTGSSLKEIDKLQSAGGVNAYIDDGKLVVKEFNIPLTGKKRILSLDSGMIGVPEFTEQGIRVKFLLDNQTTLGGALEITSIMNPAANGTYIIYKLQFEIASRDTPFYFVAEAKRI